MILISKIPILELKTMLMGGKSYCEAAIKSFRRGKEPVLGPKSLMLRLKASFCLKKTI